MRLGSIRPILGKVVLSIMGTALALLIAECGVRSLRDDAFPFLNNFVTDSRYGVVLEANSQTATRSRGGTITEVSINSQGYRGPSWKKEGEANVLILGDSQAFGYGVSWSMSLPASLQELLPDEAQVLGAGVPTWGPKENTLALEELAPIYKPKRVVILINMANDWLEAPVANIHRTTAENGWARIRRGPVDHGQDSFAPWSYVIRHSHLYYLLRRARHASSSASRAVSPGLMVLRQATRLSKSGAFRSPIGPSLANAKELCVEHECEVLVALLPIDVHVDAAEWPKYAGTAKNTEPLNLLADDLAADAARLELSFVDLRPALQAASPGAFLDDDYHLSAKGHQVVAQEIFSHIRPLENRIGHARN